MPAWTSITLWLITITCCAIWWPPCFPSSHLQCTQKARARLLSQRHPGHIHLLCKAEWKAAHAARAWPKCSFHISAAKEYTEAQVLLQGLWTSAPNADSMVFLASDCPGEPSNTRKPQVPSFPGKGRARANTHLQGSRATSHSLKMTHNRDSTRQLHPIHGKAKAPVFKSFPQLSLLTCLPFPT